MPDAIIQTSIILKAPLLVGDEGERDQDGHKGNEKKLHGITAFFSPDIAQVVLAGHDDDHQD
ncbi:hypothetical protein FRUB_08509 [Fimbriiglobus ruber]|uniref:Uncharacterized protein n=1 Tax=Fimbriiglobus ruber TaxID=1908690 RepID=A0A225DF32_9BACT|nr:hypothetical protein FRUB_08509 [Fimbriiglobus ruber]